MKHIFAIFPIATFTESMRIINNASPEMKTAALWLGIVLVAISLLAYLVATLPEEGL